MTITPTPYTWIATDLDLTALVTRLSQVPIIAVDTESDSLYSYFDKVCLVQISTPTENVIVDPLAVDITPFGDILADPAIEKIFHAAEYDVMTLRRDYGFTFSHLFDTMLAARTLGYHKYGLASLLAQHFNLSIDKTFQQYNWGQRPLSDAALAYASQDTQYLLSLRDLLLRELQQHKRLKAAQAAFAQVTQVRAVTKIFQPSDARNLKGAKRLSTYRRKLLQKLYILRDRAARQADRPPFRIINDYGLVQIVKQCPKTLPQLQKIKGVSPVFSRHHGATVLSLVRDYGQRDRMP